MWFIVSHRVNKKTCKSSIIVHEHVLVAHLQRSYVHSIPFILYQQLKSIISGRRAELKVILQLYRSEFHSQSDLQKWNFSSYYCTKRLNKLHQMVHQWLSKIRTRWGIVLTWFLTWHTPNTLINPPWLFIKSSQCRRCGWNKQSTSHALSWDKNMRIHC